MNDSESVYLVGRTTTTYPCEGNPITDRLFAGQRLDNTQIENKSFHHCTFSNVSFKEVTIKDTEFLDCSFIGCYFRKSKIQSCRFPGSKFMSCQFPRISIQACDFIYAFFEDCVLPFAEMEHNLPPQPNLRQELSANLSHVAETLGLTKEARNYRLNSIAAHELHLWSAVCSKTSWYQQHYPGINRIQAFTEYIASKANGLLWGYGEKWGILLRNFAILTFLIVPLTLWLSRIGLNIPGGSSPSLMDLEWLSIGTILSIDGISSITVTTSWTKVILIAEALLGLVIAGLFISLFFKAIVRR
jgi:hypothetical protein